MKRSYVQIDGVLYERGTEPNRAQVIQGPMVIPDIKPFVSPIDRTIVSSRAGVRDHCARYSVVPTAELQGLKPPDNSPKKHEIREAIIDSMYRRGYLKP